MAVSRANVAGRSVTVAEGALMEPPMFMSSAVKVTAPLEVAAPVVVRVPVETVRFSEATETVSLKSRRPLACVMLRFPVGVNEPLEWEKLLKTLRFPAPANDEPPKGWL